VIDGAVLAWWVGLASGPASSLLAPAAVRVTVPSAQGPVYWAVLALAAVAVLAR